MLRTLSTLLFFLLPWSATQLQAEGKPIVVTSFTIIQDWVQNIARQEFTIVNLIPPKSDAHDYQLSPRNAQDLHRATLIVAMSPELEPWLVKWCQANHRAEAVLWLNAPTPSKQKNLLEENPHAWTRAPNVRLMTKAIAEKIATIKPGSNAQIHYNQYLKTIDSVDEELARLFARLRPDQRTFISQHPNLEPFAQHYGLKVADTILASSSAESADPSAHRFSSLLALIRKEKIRVIVTDAGHNDAFARRLTEDAGIPPPIALSFEYLEPAGQSGDTWASMMLLNGKRLYEALNQE